MVRLLAVVGLLVLPGLSLAATPPSRPPSGIVGGTEAKSGQFSSILALTLNGKRHCAATLIGAETVLTAAHCVDKTEFKKGLQVRAGSLKWNSGGTVVNVTKVTTHPTWLPRLSIHNGDIAILKLAGPIDESTDIKYAKLPAQGSDLAAKALATLAGWGRTVYLGPSSETLLFVAQTVTDREKCNVEFYPGQITDNMICAGREGYASCHGDSGGPLYAGTGKTNELVGVVSGGLRCATPKGSIYTRVGEYVDWIKKNMA